MSHATIPQSGALLHTHRQSGRRDHTRRGKRVGARSAKQVEGNVGAAEVISRTKKSRRSKGELPTNRS